MFVYTRLNEFWDFSLSNEYLHPVMPRVIPRPASSAKQVGTMTGDPNKAVPLPSGPASLCFDKDVFMKVIMLAAPKIKALYLLVLIILKSLIFVAELTL